MDTYYNDDTICAIATPTGIGAVAIIRVSGSDCFKIIEKVFKPVKKGLKISNAQPQKLYRGQIIDKDSLLDEILVTTFRGPKSYTGEDISEIHCHGSEYIQQKILEVLTNNGARIAKPGEFTLRAFLNGKIDLSQAEAIADLIASTSEASHNIALKQMRGYFSWRIEELRRQLIDFSSLIELELDFSEEDVEFADRDELFELLNRIEKEINSLIDSFSVGNVIKTGVPVAITGKPNVGKSTLLNTILNEEKAIVNETPGTTRDAIEDTIIIDGIKFRFIDTAGLRDSSDSVEKIGVQKAYQKIDQASVILYVVDISETTIEEIKENIKEFLEKIKDGSKKIILVANKVDKLLETPKKFRNFAELETIFISAKRKTNINLITDALLRIYKKEIDTGEDFIVSNVRHHQALKKAHDAIKNIQKGLEENLSGDLLSIDIRSALHYLGIITGTVSVEDILDNIFAKFCIGK